MIARSWGCYGCRYTLRPPSEPRLLAAIAPGVNVGIVYAVPDLRLLACNGQLLCPGHDCKQAALQALSALFQATNAFSAAPTEGSTLYDEQEDCDYDEEEEEEDESDERVGGTLALEASGHLRATCPRLAAQGIIALQESLLLLMGTTESFQLIQSSATCLYELLQGLPARLRAQIRARACRRDAITVPSKSKPLGGRARTSSPPAPARSQLPSQPRWSVGFKPEVHDVVSGQTEETGDLPQAVASGEVGGGGGNDGQYHDGRWPLDGLAEVESCSTPGAAGGIVGEDALAREEPAEIAQYSTQFSGWENEDGDADSVGEMENLRAKASRAGTLDDAMRCGCFLVPCLFSATAWVLATCEA